MRTILLRNLQYIMLMITLLSICGCVTTRDDGDLWSYGKFCGPGEPEVFGQTKVVRLAELEMIQAKDDIDELCKEHDMCYELGADDSQCDKDLRRNLLSIKFDAEVEYSCLKVRDQILIAFSCIKPTGYQPDHYLTALITIPLDLLICSFSTPMASLGSFAETPNPGECNAVNDFRKHRELTEQCFERAGTDLNKLVSCQSKFGRPARSNNSSALVKSKPQLNDKGESCVGGNMWKSINGVSCLVDACGNILDNKNDKCLDQTN